MRINYFCNQEKPLKKEQHLNKKGERRDSRAQLLAEPQEYLGVCGSLKWCGLQSAGEVLQWPQRGQAGELLQ